MSNLFMRRHAVISDCELYRHELRRIWDDRLPVLVVVMLNPSRADDTREDPTLLALIGFARLWGYGGLLIVNLYDWRSSSPAAMRREPARRSDRADGYLEAALAFAQAHETPVLVAWGNEGDFEGEAGRLVDRARRRGVPLICLGTTAGGAPKHPMARGLHRIPRDQQPIMWKAAAKPVAAAQEHCPDFESHREGAACRECQR